MCWIAPRSCGLAGDWCGVRDRHRGFPHLDRGGRKACASTGCRWCAARRRVAADPRALAESALTTTYRRFLDEATDDAAQRQRDGRARYRRPQDRRQFKTAAAAAAASEVGRG